MTEKELKRLSRAELLEMLIAQSRKLAHVEKSLEALTKEQEKREIGISSSGTLAEAALKLNEIFDSADKAAEQYLENVRMRESDAENIIAEANEQADSIIAKANENAENIIAEANKKAKTIIIEARVQAEDILDDAKTKPVEIKESVTKKAAQPKAATKKVQATKPKAVVKVPMNKSKKAVHKVR